MACSLGVLALLFCADAALAGSNGNGIGPDGAPKGKPKACATSCECTLDQICWNGKCLKDTPRDDQSCVLDDECGAGKACHDHSCVRDHATCQACSTGADCDAGDVCRGGFCTTPDDDDDACSADADCAPGQSCKNGKCKKKGPRDECTVDADCEDGDVCKNDKCHKPGPHDECREDADCADDEVCKNGKCHKAGPHDECREDADCAAGEVCKNGKCHQGDGPSPACTVDADCEAGQVCREGECRPVDGGENCNDNDGCTTDELVGGACVHTPIPGCGTGQAEICGDCIDNDGNGMTDLEDAACCTPGALELGKARIVPKGATSRVRLRATFAHTGMDNDRLAQQDVVLQIRPADGKDILCARIPGAKFIKRGKRFRYQAGKQDLATARGISGMGFKVKRNGSLKMKAFGQKVNILDPRQGGLQITVGFQNHSADSANTCSAMLSTFRVKHKALVAR